MEKKKRVFLSYSFKDKSRVDQIAKELNDNGIDIYKDSSIVAGTSWEREIKYRIETSEIVLIFLSSNFSASSWINNELLATLKEFHKRKITVLLVLLEKTNVPSDLLGFEYINLTGNFESGIDKIVKKLKVIPEITFDTFDPLQFENLVADLLKEYNFKNIERSGSTQDSGIDIIAGYESKNPFGTSYLESWIVQVKFYKQDRFSVSTLQQLISNKSKLSYSGATLLLVTNSILTSAAQEFLEDQKKFDRTRIEVIDGVALKLLISKRKRLLDKYFSR